VQSVFLFFILSLFSSKIANCQVEYYYIFSQLLFSFHMPIAGEMWGDLSVTTGLLFAGKKNSAG